MKPPYQLTPRILELVGDCLRLIGRCEGSPSSRPLPRLRRRNRIRTIHGSLTIEGNTLDLDQVTAVLDGKRVAGPARDVKEVTNAIAAYDQLAHLIPHSLESLCRAHELLTNGLVARPGTLRQGAVGIARAGKVMHVAPPASMVHPLLKDLLRYVRKGTDNLLVRSCVFHYELEFIHPFVDGNGRLGRLWQTVILRRQFPLFDHLPVESLVHDRQKAYYAALAKSDAAGQATAFVEFMLAAMRDALEEYAGQLVLTRPSRGDRLEHARSEFGARQFSRQAYQRCLKTVSAPTASRDLQYGVESGMLQRTGDKRTARYCFTRRREC